MSKIFKTFVKLRNDIENWRTKTPKQKWQTIFDIGGILSESVGVTVFTTMENYWYSYISEVLSFIYFSSAFYTIWFYSGQGEFLRGLQGTCVVGNVFACLVVQMKTLGPERYKMNSLLNFGGRYIFMDNDQSPKLRLLQVKLIDRLVRNIVIVTLLMIFAYGMSGIHIAYLIIIGGDRINMFGTELPFVDKDSEFGYWINTSVQLLLAIVGFIACLIVEIGAALISNSGSSVPLLLHVDFEELETELRLNGFSLMAEARLRNAFMRIQDYEKFLQGSIELYYTRLFFGPFLFTYSISLAIFNQLVLDSPIGYEIAVGLYVQLLVCCHLGEVCKRCKTEIVAELYNMAWYMLPTNYQRQICSAIHMIQNGSSVTIGPLSELNMETLTDLTRTIYRFTMVIYKASK